MSAAGLIAATSKAGSFGACAPGVAAKTVSATTRIRRVFILTILSVRYPSVSSVPLWCRVTILTLMKRLGFAFLLVAVLVSSVFAQQRGRGGRLSVGVAEVPLPNGPVVLDTAEEHKIRVVDRRARAVAPVGDGVAAERRPARHRAARTASDHPQRRARSDADLRPAADARARTRRAARRRAPSELRHQQADLFLVREGRREGRDDGRGARTARRHGADRRPGHLRRRVVDEGQRSRRRALRIAHRVREGRDAVHHVRRSRSSRWRTESRTITSARSFA